MREDDVASRREAVLRLLTEAYRRDAGRTARRRAGMAFLAQDQRAEKIVAGPGRERSLVISSL